MSSIRNKVAFRADGNHIIGLGHIVRCLALADLLKKNFDIIFLCKELAVEQKNMILKSFRLIELKSKNLQEEIGELTNILFKTDILVLDGYSFDLAYQTKVKKMINKLVMIDDFADRKLIADLVINHGGEFIINKYNLEKGAKLLTGFKYLLLRKEFLQERLTRKAEKKNENVFICMGGADPFNITPKVLKACIDSGFVKKIIVVVGSLFRNFDEIKELVNTNTSVKIEIERNVDAQRIVQLISESQIAICPSSSIALEVCCVGSGILTGTFIDNQNAIHEQIVRNNCGISLGDFNAVSSTDIINFLQKFNGSDLVKNLVQNQKEKIGSSKKNYLLEEFKILSNEN